MGGSVERKEGYVITKINNKCNSLCNFCADDWNVRNKPDPSFEDIKEQLDNGIKQGFHKLIITGGEPTISPNLFKVIDYAREIGYDTIYLTTNGRALSIDHFFNKIINVIDRFLVSFFEFYPEVYDDIAGVKSYLQVLTGLKRLSRVNKEYMVNAVITKQNYTHMRELLILLISLNAKHIQFSFLNPVGFARRFKDKVLINYKDVIPYVYEVIKTAEYLNFKNFSFEKRGKMKKKIFLLVFSLLFARILDAAILNVPTDYATIQSGIDSSTVGDTVLVQPGTYVENINYNGKNITVASLFLTTQDSLYINQTIIDGNHINSTVIFCNAEDTTAVICGFTITNGYGFWGGGISCLNSSPKISHNYICDNETFYLIGIYDGGGGIRCAGGSPLIYNNKILHNNVEHGYGGGIVCCQSSPEIKNTEIYINYSSEEDLIGGGIFYCDSSEVNIVNCTIHGNIAHYGGGVYCNNSGGKIKNSVIDNNDMVDQYTSCGGGVYCTGNSDLIFTGVTISNHSYDDQGEYGGGVYCSNSNMLFYNCEFLINLSSFGGGICCVNNSNIECDNTNFYTNEGGNSGGCFYCDNSNIILSNSIIDDSDALSYGGAMYVLNDSYVRLDSVSLFGNDSSVGGGINVKNSILDVYSCHFRYNGACDGGAIISFNSDLDVFNSLFVSNGTYEGGSAIDARNSSDVYCCNVTITDNYAQTNCGGIKCSSTSNIEMYNSIMWNDTQPEIIGNNVSVLYSDIQGGWVGTGNIDNDPLFADTLNEDYHLTQDSPCVDAGTPDTTGLNIPPWDMDGNIRVWDSNGSGVAIIDMGAYEYGAPSYSIHEPEILHESILYNFPNPTQNSTTIKYTLKQNSHVIISIYNIKGQLVSTLVNETKPKGEYSVMYDTEALSSGVYFYKMQTEDKSEIKKMIVIK